MQIRRSVYLLAGLAAAALGVATPAFAGKKRASCPPGCQTAPMMIDGQPASEPSAAGPSAMEQSLEQSLASSPDFAGGANTLTPNFFGDSLSIGGNFFYGYINAAGQSVSANTSASTNGGRRVKIAEAVSPMPRDRVFVQYNLFKDAYQTQGVAGGVNALGTDQGAPPGQPGGPGAGSKSFDSSRFTFGIEKTFFDGLTSVEVRIPFSNTLGSQVFVTENTIPGTIENEFGNISLALKLLLWRRERMSISTGVVTNFPTADTSVNDQTFSDALGGPISQKLVIHDDAYHVSPFLGSLLTPNDRLFIQSFVQVDIPVNSNGVDFITTRQAPGGGTTTTEKFDSLKDQTLFQADVAIGYWLYRRNEGLIRGIAPIAELHYTTTTEDAETLFAVNAADFTGGGSQYRAVFGNTLNRMDVLNLTLGSAVQWGERGTLGVGFVLPLNRDDFNSLFDWEFNMQLNYRFGSACR